MNENEYTNQAYEISNILEEANQDYIVRLGQHVRIIENEDGDEIDYVAIHNRTEDDIHKINKNVKNACIIASGMAINLYHNHAQDVYSSMSIYYKAKNVTQVPFYKNTSINHFMYEQAKRTQVLFDNLSKTTVVDKAYRDAVDNSIKAIQSGKSNYQREIRKILSDASIEGTRVQYASGATRRLDSACRMNILEGVRRVDKEIYRITGEEFGADGMEISAHALCAPDHLDIQGEQMTLNEYDEMNRNLDRPIGELNCQHKSFPIVLGVSQPTYTAEDLDNLRNYSEEEIELDFGDKTYTKSRYECSQLMRQLETNIRYQKDALLMAKANGDKVAEQMAKAKIYNYKGKYDYVCRKSGLPPQPKRMSVPSRTVGYTAKFK